MSAPDPYADFVQRTGAALVAQGVPRMPAYVIMALTASDEGRLTAGELAERLQVSPAAISTAIRYLAAIGFVRTQRIPGSRRHSYELVDGPWYAASLRRPGLYLHVETELREALAQLPEESPARARIEEMADFFGFVSTRMPALVDEWAEGRARRQE